MKFDLKEILGAAGREGSERMMHGFIADWIKKEMAKGKNARNIVIDLLVNIKNSPLLRLVKETFGAHTTGLLLTSAAAGFVKWMQMLDWDLIAPEDQGPVMREIRFLLQSVLPGLLVGSAEGLSDTFDDEVIAAVSKIRSDDSPHGDVGGDKKAGAYDYACEVLSDDGVDYWQKYNLLFPELDSKMELQQDRFAIEGKPLSGVILAGQNGKQFALDWYATHKGVPYIVRQVPLAAALMRMPATVPLPPEVVAFVKAANEKRDVKPTDAPKGELEKLDEHGEAFTHAVAKSAAKLDPLQRALVLDFVQDVTKATDINLLGKRFPPNATGEYSLEDVKSIEMYVQMWMRAKLNTKSKIRLAFEQAKMMHEAGEGWMKTATTIALNVGKRFMRIFWTLAVTFVLALLLFITGGLVLDASYAITTWFVLIGGSVMIAELFLITPIQATLSLVQWVFPKTKDMDQNSLVNKGRILIMFIGIHMALFMILIFLGVETKFRIGICIPTMLALAIQMGLIAYGYEEEARLRSRSNLRWFGRIATAVFVTVLAVAILQSFGKTGQFVLDYIKGSNILQSLIILGGAGFIVAKVVRRIEVTHREILTSGEVVKTEYRRNWWLRSIGIALVLLMTAWPWIGDNINTYFEKKPVPSSSAAVPQTTKTVVVVQPAPVAQPLVVPVTISVKPPRVRHKRASAEVYDEKKEKREFYSGFSPEMRERNRIK